jgi:hypothetical protein
MSVSNGVGLDARTRMAARVGRPNMSGASVSAALGLNVRTGRAVTVVLTGRRRAPSIVLRDEIGLADPWVPESGHPYHQELHDHSAAGVQAQLRGCQAARKASRRAIRALVSAVKAHDLEPHGAAVVTSSLDNPERARSAHGRAHAQEDRLYFEAVERALAECALRVVTLCAKDLRDEADRRLAGIAQPVTETLKAFSHVVGTPWGTAEKQAALAAWLLLPS